MVDEGWEIEPGVGVGPARFGSDRSALRAQFGPARAFRGVRLAGKMAKVVAALRAAGADPVDDGEGGWSLAGG
jgi:hypothetical protein